MLKKVLKWTAITVAGIVLLIAVAGFSLYVKGQSKAGDAPEVAAAALPKVTKDSATLARGQHIAEAIAPCAGCHGAGLKGQKFGTPDVLVRMDAPNLTRGKGGVGAEYTLEDWDRAVRRGIGRDGRQLIIMPSHAYARMSDADFAALVAYLETVPPVDNETAARKVGPVGAILIGAGQFPLAADVVEKEKPQPSTVQPARSVDYGDYLVRLGTCRDCHGENLNGAPGHGGPAAPSLFAKARNWTEEDFRNTIRSGRTPEGKVLDPVHMPWPFFAKMTDDELAAVWLYLRSLPVPKATES